MMAKLVASVIYPLMNGEFLPKKLRPIWQAGWIGATAILVIKTISVLSPYSFVINHTESLPKGIYFAKKIDLSQATYGDVVCFPVAYPDWAKDRGYAKEGTRFCKPIAAKAGDIISVNEANVSVKRSDGVQVNLGLIKKKDKLGRELPGDMLKNGAVPPGTVVLISTYSVDSFDSRYLGVVPTRSLTLQVYPFIIW